MTRITTPRPTSGLSPSHSPPDTVYAPGIGLARALGWFSIGLGLIELVMPHQVTAWTGVRSEPLLRAYGVREIVTGVGILSSTRPTGWMWGRVAGDALDIATLVGSAAENSHDDHHRTWIATAAVGGVTALDTICAAQLSAAAALEG